MQYTDHWKSLMTYKRFLWLYSTIKLKYISRLACALVTEPSVLKAPCHWDSIQIYDAIANSWCICIYIYMNIQQKTHVSNTWYPGVLFNDQWDNDYSHVHRFCARVCHLDSVTLEDLYNLFASQISPPKNGANNYAYLIGLFHLDKVQSITIKCLTHGKFSMTTVLIAVDSPLTVVSPLNFFLTGLISAHIGGKWQSWDLNLVWYHGL